MKKPLLISACLLGLACRYDGERKPMDKALLDALMERWQLIPVCPEQLGGLATPRTPAERQGDRVVSAAGRDVTAQYRLGAAQACALCRLFGCKDALLKERSPSCGSGKVYDGSFTGTLTAGDGVTAAALKARGIRVYGESEIDALT